MVVGAYIDRPYKRPGHGLDWLVPVGSVEIGLEIAVETVVEVTVEVVMEIWLDVHSHVEMLVLFSSSCSGVLPHGLHFCD